MSILTNFLIIIQIIVAILLILIVLIQSSDEDSLSGMAGSASQTKLLSHKSSADLVTKITIYLGIIFMLNSFFLTSVFTKKYLKDNKSVVQDYLQKEKKDNLKDDLKNNNKDIIIDNKKK